MNLERLKDPFPPEDIEWRIERVTPRQLKDGTTKYHGVVLAYITNRAIMDRLDDVCGHENWCNEYREWHAGSQLCGIGIKVYDSWIWKWDGADNTDKYPTKGGLSDAMKRAGVQWGIGRYLYRLEANRVAMMTRDEVHEGVRDKVKWMKIKETDEWVAWLPPELPDWALPNETAPHKRGKK